MKILMIASEVTPFAKTGGLADVIGSLPKELKRMGHDVRIIMPFYKEVEKGGFSIRKGRKSAEITLGGTVEKGLMRQASLGDIPVYLLEHKGYFYRDSLYGTNAGDYPDNAERFAFFCRGVIDLLKKMDFRPDVLHCHDWQTALIPVVLKYEMSRDPFFARTITLFTIHNLAYQGLFPPEKLPKMGLDESTFSMDRLEFYGKVNLMKGGILAADIVNTVSKTYSREILSKEYGCGLEGVLQARGGSLYGILNGIDYTAWNPAVDRELVKNYTSSALSGRASNKLALQNQLRLDQKVDVPILAMVSRLVSQKGLDLLIDVLPRLAEHNLQLVILGAGDKKYVEQLTEYQRSNPGRASVTIDFNSPLSHRIYAGSDMLLMPSHYEPCGLGQLIALRYGAVPIARKTGGLADTIQDSRDGVKEPNGFTFDDYTGEGLWSAIERAVQMYREDRVEWKKLMRRGMTSDYSWQRSAEHYEELYLLGLRGKRAD